MNRQIEVVDGDVLEFHCDVLVLKYAQDFYGVDKVVASHVLHNYKDIISPSPSEFKMIVPENKFVAKRVLFVGVDDLYDFSYPQIREFAKRSIEILWETLPHVRHIAMTIHGVGYGLDEKEAFTAQIAGLVDALANDHFPPHLEKITILERNAHRVTRLQTLLTHLLGPQSSDRLGPRNETQRKALESAGNGSLKKPHIFVAMPFNDDMADTFHYGIEAPIQASGYLCERIDLTSFTGDILTRILHKIETASIVVADLTGANPNVYLEVGYAWGKNRQTLLLAKQGTERKFDVQGQRTIIYKNIKDLEERLKSDLEAMSDRS